VECRGVGLGEYYAGCEPSFDSFLCYVFGLGLGFKRYSVHMLDSLTPVLQLVSWLAVSVGRMLVSNEVRMTWNKSSRPVSGFFIYLHRLAETADSLIWDSCLGDGQSSLGCPGY
jgi:hypothetical protein